MSGPSNADQILSAVYDSTSGALKVTPPTTSTLQLTPVTFAALPASPVAGMVAVITNSAVNTWGTAITTTGSYQVLAWYNGSNWTVIGV